MMFHRTRIKNKATEDRVHLCGNNLISVSNTKFLGVIIDSKLNWSDHITYIKNIISKSIGILTKIRRFLNNKKTLRNLYLSFVYPYLTYCDSRLHVVEPPRGRSFIWSQLIHPGPASSMTKFFLVSSQSCVSTLPH